MEYDLFDMVVAVVNLTEGEPVPSDVIARLIDAGVDYAALEQLYSD